MQSFLTFKERKSERSSEFTFSSKSQQISAAFFHIKQRCNETAFNAKWFSISESFSQTQINIDLHFALISRVCSIIQSPGLL